MNKDYVCTNKICSVFTRWEKMCAKQDKLTDHDKKLLLWGLKELSHFTKPEKMAKAKALRGKWKELGREIAECQTDLQELRHKWDQKVKDAENIAFWCDALGGILAAGGIIGAVFTAVAAYPVWVPCAFGAAAIMGAGVMIAGNANLRECKGIQKQIVDMQQHMKSYEDILQNWTTAIELLEFPLGSIAATSEEDFEQEFEKKIKSWEKIAEHERDLLKTAAKTFTVFRDESLESLNRIRNVQRKLRL